MRPTEVENLPWWSPVRERFMAATSRGDREPRADADSGVTGAPEAEGRARSRSHSTCTLNSDPTNGSRATSADRHHIWNSGGHDLTLEACKAGTLRSQGLYVDAHQLVLDRLASLDVFKGALVILMHTSNVIFFLGTKDLTTKSMLSRTICNLAASQCFIGFMMAFGYSCYRQYLREWPDPPKDVNRSRNRVLRTIALPIVGAWICNFAWCFLHAKKDSPASVSLALEVFTFTSVFGNGADFLLSFSINLALVYSLWRPINNLLDSVKPGTHWIDAIYPQCRRDAACVALVFSPLLFTLIHIPDCTGNLRWAQWLFVCSKRDPDTPTLPAIPHLLDFGIGVLCASAWDRFIAILKPVGDGGTGGGLHLLPMDACQHWSAVILSVAAILLLFFVPLGQVWPYADLMQANVATPVGQLVRGFTGGPSAVWLLATIWPSAVWAASAGVLVSLRGGPAGYIIHYPLAMLEHFGANVLYYLVVVDVFLAGMSTMTLGDPSTMGGALDTTSCIFCTFIILSFARFLHFAAQGARK